MNHNKKMRRHHELKIKDFFESSMKVKEGHLLNWDIISIALEYFRSSARFHPYTSEALFNFIVQLFDRYKCRDMKIFAKIFVRYCLYNCFLCCSCESICDTTADVHILKLMKMKYGEFRSCTQMDPIRIALRRPHENVLDFLIQKGVAYLPLIDDSCEWMYLNHCLKSLSKPEFLQFENVRDLELKISKKYKSTEARRRLLTVLKGLEILSFTQTTGLYETLSRCLQKIFLTIPEPHVTSQEFREFLRHISHPSRSHPSRSHPKAGKVIEELSRGYESIFPESCKAKQPRSLFHLSRCQVRQNLRTAGTFPHGINQLDLPKQLEKSVLQNCLTYKPYLN